MIEAAIIGLGRWGQTLVDSVHGVSDAIRFTRAVTRTVAKAAGYAADKGIALGADYDAVLADPAIDAVVLATPHTLHCDQICAAAAAGKHVFCEKPLSLTAADARRAIAAAEAAGVTLAIGHNRRFAPNTVALREAVTAGRLGTPLHVEGNFTANLTGAGGTWRSDARESPAGGMTSLGIHVVDAFIDLIGTMSAVSAKSRRLALPFVVDDATSVLLDFENGCTGYLGTVAASAQLYQIRVIGTHGWAEIGFLDRFEAMFTDGTGDRLSWDVYDYHGYRTVRACLEAFAGAAEGGPAFPIPPSDFAHATAVLEAIVTSARSGAPQPV